MHPPQIIFLVLIALAFAAGCRKSARAMIGGALGAVLGFFGPLLYGQYYVWRGGDPTAVGALFILCFLTIPLGIALGIVVALLIPTRKPK